MSKCYRSQLVGAFGCPIDENPTGVMEEAAFKAMGLDYRYLTIKVEKEDLEDAIKAVKAFQMKGINITIPHKIEVLKFLDQVSEAAEIIGAVNMIVNQEGKLYGENTDGKGYLKSLTDRGISVAGKTITVLGAGGVARAISVECALAGAKKLYIANIEKKQGEELAELIRTKTGSEAEFIFWNKAIDVPEDTDILSNATSVGLFPHTEQKPNINYDSVKSYMIVTDVIFNDPNSIFIKEAQRRGAETINGLGMLVNQGALNFTMWTGVEAPVDIMMETLKKEFNLS